VRRMQGYSELKQVLAETLCGRWKEATTRPPQELRHLLEGGNDQYRQNLVKAQGLCKELKPYIGALTKVLAATQKQPVADAQTTAKDYRLNPVDGLMERPVYVQGAHLWVSVMPTTVIPPEFFTISQLDTSST